jgi:hypothetical protein
MHAGVKIYLPVVAHLIALVLRDKLVMDQIHEGQDLRQWIANNHDFVHVFLNQIFQKRLLVKS